MPRLAYLSICLLAVFFAWPAKAETQPVEIPFTFTDGFIRVQARVPQCTEPLYFLLDSGAGASVLSLRTAQRLHIPLGKTESVRGVGVSAAAHHLAGVDATASGVLLSNVSLAVDLSAADELCSKPIDGLIGVGFFKDRVVQIDYTRRVLRVGAAVPATAAERLPIKMMNGIMCVPVGVNDSTSRWTRFDTGCNDSLHWVIPRTAARGDHNAVSIGFVTDTDDTSLTSVSLGKRALHTVKTALHGSPLFPGEAGLLGNGILSQFVVTVDWPNRQVLLTDAPR
ncbi:MAG TPA: aspartyl protease family protein [Chthoniobacter sp.]|nr:aspartyl protease family protein [Chthoniobacter sp.]